MPLALSPPSLIRSRPNHVLVVGLGHPVIFMYTLSLAVKGHDIQGSPVKILTKIRVTIALNGLRIWGLRVTF